MRGPIRFNNPSIGGNEELYIKQAMYTGRLAGDNQFTHKCKKILEEITGCRNALLTPSCTAALELTALLMDLSPGDEIIMPSYTFVSTANAYALRGATPVFVDIDINTMNISPNLVKNAITSKTKAVVAVNYAGSCCDLNQLSHICSDNNVVLIEDAAQSIRSYFDGHHLGTIGAMGTMSFHETKNISCGEGGVLLINDESYLERAEILREKGTNRSQFFRGQVDKYTWVDVGSSYLLSDLNAAYLLAQLESSCRITDQRIHQWNLYDSQFYELEEIGLLKRPRIQDECSHNGHIYYLLLASLEERQAFLAWMKSFNIYCTFHYVPLHSSSIGSKYGKLGSSMKNTIKASDCLARLPMGPGFDIEYVIAKVYDFFQSSEYKMLG